MQIKSAAIASAILAFTSNAAAAAAAAAADGPRSTETNSDAVSSSNFAPHTGDGRAMPTWRGTFGNSTYPPNGTHPIDATTGHHERMVKLAVNAEENVFFKTADCLKDCWDTADHIEENVSEECVDACKIPVDHAHIKQMVGEHHRRQNSSESGHGHQIVMASTEVAIEVSNHLIGYQKCLRKSDSEICRQEIKDNNTHNTTTKSAMHKKYVEIENDASDRFSVEEGLLRAKMDRLTLLEKIIKRKIMDITERLRQINSEQGEKDAEEEKDFDLEHKGWIEYGTEPFSVEAARRKTIPTTFSTMSTKRTAAPQPSVTTPDCDKLKRTDAVSGVICGILDSSAPAM